MRLLSSLRTIHASLYVLLTILIVSAQPLAGSETGAFELEGELRSADLQVRARAAMERINQSMIRTDYAAVPVYLAILHEAAIQSGNPLINAQWNLQQARLLIANGERVNALPFAEAARGIANSLGEAELEVDALRTLGNIFIQMHDYTQALTYLGEAVAVARTISDRNRIATVLNSMAICFWRVRDWHQAENYLLQALEYYLEDERMRLLFENNIGVALMEQGRYDEALERFYRALEANRIAGHSYSQSLNYSNLGDLYQRMGNTSLARPYLERSLEMAEQFSLDYVALRSSRHWGLMLAKEGDVEGAIEYARRALQIAITSGDRAEELESLEALITIYEQAGLYQDALNVFRKRVELQESLLSNQLLIRTALFNVQYASAERDRSLAELTAETQRERYRRNAILAALVILIFLIAGLYFRYRYTTRVNRELEEKNHTIEVSHKHLSGAYRELEELSREKDEIMAIAAHDLRAPMATARSVAALLLDQPEQLRPEQRAELLRDLLHTCDHMLATVAKLLQSHRLESKQIECTLEPVSAVSLREHIKRGFALAAASKKQEIVFSDWSDAMKFLADPTLLHQVLDNLVSNALKFSPPGSTVRLVCAPKKSDLQRGILAVIDQGPGIPLPQMPFLFKKYSKVGNLPTAGEQSTGLGLSIARKLTLLMHGELNCYSEHGKGARFEVELPLFFIREKSVE